MKFVNTVYAVMATLILSLIVASCAVQTRESVESLSHKMWEPIPGEEFLIIDLSTPDLHAVCEATGGFITPPGWRVYACVLEIGQVTRGEVCTIFMDGTLPHGQYDKILRHEKAHCRGWNHGWPVPAGEVG